MNTFSAKRKQLFKLCLYFAMLGVQISSELTMLRKEKQRHKRSGLHVSKCMSI